MSNYNSGAYNTEVAPKTVWVSNRHKYLVAVVQESSVPTEVRYTIQSTYVNDGIVKQVPIDRFLKRFEPTTESTVEAGSVWSCLASNKLSAVVNSVDGDEVSFTFNNEITGQEQKRKSPLKVFRAAYTEGLSSSDLDVDEEENKARIRKSTEQAIEQLEGLKEHYELGYNGGFEKGYNKGCEETLEMCVDKEVGVIPIKIANKTKSNSKSSDKSSIAVSNSIIKDDSIINNTNTKEEQTYKSKYTMDSNSGTGKTGEYKLIGIHGLAHSGKDKVGKYLLGELEADWKRGAFADIIKDMLAVMGIDCSDESKDTVDPYYEAPVRKLMQTLGSDWGRDMIDEDIWIKAFKKANPSGNFIMTDVRRENEAAFVRENGVLIHLTGRGGIDGSCKSEGGIEVKEEDIVLDNLGSLESLQSQLKLFIRGMQYGGML